MKPIVVLDRDGVINFDSDQYIKTVAEWRPIPGSIEAIAKLSSAGFPIAVATNQSGIARGYFTVETLTAMHDKMCDLVAQAGGKIDCIVYCPHGPDDGCDCRKPLPGLLDQVATDLGRPVSNGFLVGDSLRDLEAGQARDMQPVLVKTGKGERTLTAHPQLAATVDIYSDLASFVVELTGQ